MAGIELDGVNQKVVLDSDGDTYLEAATDDTIKVYVAGAHDATISANAINVLSGTTLTIDSGATIANSGTATGFSSADPASADGDSLGTASLEWSDLFLADGGIIKFGNDQEVLLTHVADTGLLLNSTMKLQFNDASQFIQGTSATVLSIAATDEIDLTATAVDLNGTLNVSGTYTGGGTMTTGGNIVTPADSTVGNGDGEQIAFNNTADTVTITSGGNAAMVFDTAGIVTKPLQPLFKAQQTSALSVADGHTLFSGNITEAYDVNADFNDGTFTAPVSGYYQFSFTVLYKDMGTGGADDAVEDQFISSNLTETGARWGKLDDAILVDAYGQSQATTILFMDANDTCYLKHTNGGTMAVHTSATNSHFEGHLLQ